MSKKVYRFNVQLLIMLFTLFSMLGCERMELVKEGNFDKKPLEFKLGFIQCPQCHMEVETLNNVAQVVLDDGKTYIFDDAGCMILWIEDNGYNPANLTIWIYSHDTKRWIDAKKAYYSLTDKTPMLYGFGAYENNKEDLIDFNEMRLKMLRGENLTNPKIRKKLLGY